MNDDFEKKLLALTGALRRTDPTSEWKSEILARARREANVIRYDRVLPPRVLLAAWAAGWAAIVLLSIETPANGSRIQGSNAVALQIGHGDETRSGASVPSVTLLALGRQDSLNGYLQ